MLLRLALDKLHKPWYIYKYHNLPREVEQYEPGD